MQIKNLDCHLLFYRQAGGFRLHAYSPLNHRSFLLPSATSSTSSSTTEGSKKEKHHFSKRVTFNHDSRPFFSPPHPPSTDLRRGTHTNVMSAPAQFVCQYCKRTYPNTTRRAYGTFRTHEYHCGKHFRREHHAARQSESSASDDDSQAKRQKSHSGTALMM